MLDIKKRRLLNSILFFMGLPIAVILLSTACVQQKAAQESAGSSLKTKLTPKTKSLTIWFVKAKGEELELISVQRSKTGSDPLESAIAALLSGPDAQEEKSGISSEIPRGTILLGIEHKGDKVELNLSKRFSSGGGPVSVQTRLDQLAKTVKNVAGDAKVFLNIEGTRLSAGELEGLEFQQPIN